jgi:hypothetical protein
MGKPVGAVVQRAPAPAVTVNPLIELGAPGAAAPPPPVVVVRKSYTNPARTRITLRTSSNFRRSGTLSRTVTPTSGDIHIFTAAIGGTEIDFAGNTNTTFAAGRLNAGVSLVAEARARSGAANDFQLTLTLAAGPTPVGPAATITLTAIDVTLDVAVPRTSAAVDPPILSESDKINPGRFIQIRDPQFSHLRAMLILRPTNPSVAISFRLEALRGNAQAFVTELPAAGQPAQPNPATFPSGIFPATGMQLFVEGTSASTAVRNTGFRLGVVGVENEADRVVMTAVQLDAVSAGNALAPQASRLQVGLWDNAFDPATGSVRNGAADASNFVSLDSRRFFFRLRDPSASGQAQVSWSTVFNDGSGDDVSAQPGLTLLETGANTHVFLSKPLFLVTDDIDQQQGCNSSLPTGDPDSGNRTFGQRNHRLRKITVDGAHQLNNGVKAEYSPGGGPAIAASATPVFDRNPEERRRLRVHFISVRSSVGGSGVLSVVRQNRATNLFRSIYAVCGIFVEVDVIEINPPPSSLAWPTMYPGNAAFLAGPIVEGFRFAGNTLVPSTSQSDIITVVRNLASFNADDIYLVFINRILSFPLPPPPVVAPGVPPPAVVFNSGGGESFPDSFTAAGSLARGFTFVSSLAGSNNVEVHEATHITTDLRNAAGGHYDLGLPRTAVPPPNAPGNIDGRNIMHRFAPVITGNVTDPKRLWNTQVTNANYSPTLVIPPQINAIRGSRFIHAF